MRKCSCGRLANRRFGYWCCTWCARSGSTIHTLWCEKRQEHRTSITTNDDIRELLRVTRYKRGKTQRWLSERLGVSKSHVSYLENSHSAVLDVALLRRWADILDLRMEITFTDEAESS